MELLKKIGSQIPDQWKRVLRNATIAAALMAAATLSMPNNYTSEVTILPGETPNMAQTALGNLSGFLGDFGGGDEETYPQILFSRRIQNELLDKQYTFSYVTWYFGSKHQVTMKLMDFLKAKNYDDGRKALGKVFLVNRDVKSRIISFSVTTISPDLSKQLAADALKSLQTFLLQGKQTHGGEKAAFAIRRLQECQAAYDKAEERLRDFIYSNRNYQVSADPQIRLKGSRLEFEMNMVRQNMTTVANMKERALMDAENDVPIVNVLDAPNFPYVKSKPFRAAYVLFAWVLGGIATWTFTNRKQLTQRLFSLVESAGPSVS